MDLSLQNTGSFICEGGSSEPTEHPWLRACIEEVSARKSLYTEQDMDGNEYTTSGRVDGCSMLLDASQDELKLQDEL